MVEDNMNVQSLRTRAACHAYAHSATPAYKIQFEKRLKEKFGDTPQHLLPAEEIRAIWNEVFMSNALQFALPDLAAAVRVVCEVCSEDDEEFGFKVLMASWKINDFQERFIEAMGVLRNYSGLRTRGGNND